MSEYDDGFDAGILHQCLQEREEDARREHTQRVAAFGAIRRAAEVMRECEKQKGWIAASAARDAIRAAIGSPKA